MPPRKSKPPSCQRASWSRTCEANQSRPLDNEYARSQIEGIEIQRDQVVVLLKQGRGAGAETAVAAPPMVKPWQKPASKKPRDILMSESASAKAPNQARTGRAALIAAIARGRRWLDELVAGRAASVEIAIRSKRSARHVFMTISWLSCHPPSSGPQSKGGFLAGSEWRSCVNFPPAETISSASLD